MTSIYDEYKSWFAKYLEPRYPDLVTPLRTAPGAYDLIQGKEQIDYADLQPIVEVARSHHKPFYENASNLFEKLTADHQAACDAVVEMSCDKRAQIRFKPIICLGSRTSRELRTDLVHQALFDKRARVREKAAD